MKTVKKLCNGCDSLQYIWKRHNGELFCKKCWLSRSTQNNKKSTAKSIPHFSKKRSVDNKEYLKLNKQFLLNNPTCQLSIPGHCTLLATEVHHTFCGADREQYYLDISTWKSSCRACHSWCHTNSKSAKLLNLIK
jgi:hypothetical protein